MRRICSNLVPWILNNEQKQHWLCVLSDVLNNAEIIDSFITLDVNTIQKQNAKTCCDKQRITLSMYILLTLQNHACMFLWSKEDNLQWFLSKKTNCQSLKLGVLKGLQKYIQRKRPELLPDKCILHHINFPVTDALRVCKFLTEKSVTKIIHCINQI